MSVEWASSTVNCNVLPFSNLLYVAMFPCKDAFANITTQGLVYTHETVLSNPISWGLAVDAIVNGGPGRMDRINAKELSREIVAPGLTLGDLAKTEGLLLSTGASILAYPKKTLTEPKLPAYATAKPVPSSGGRYAAIAGAPAAARVVPPSEGGVATKFLPPPPPPPTAQLGPQSGGIVDAMPKVQPDTAMLPPARPARPIVDQNLVPAPLHTVPRTERIIVQHSPPSPTYNDLASTLR